MKIKNYIIMPLAIIIIIIIAYINYIENNKNIREYIDLKTTKIEEKFSFNLFKIIKFHTITTSNFENNNSIDSTEIEINVIKPKNPTELYYQNLNNLLKVSNPTNVKLLKIELSKWAGDREYFFTLFFKNNTPLPAHKFNVEIWNNNKIVKFNHSKVSEKFYNKPTISKGKPFNFPLVTKTELSKYLNINKNKILGIGINPNIPKYILDKAEVKKVLSRSFSGAHTIGLGLKYSYETIFNDKVSHIQVIYIYVDSN